MSLSITLTVGLPASGKTSWAKEQQELDPSIVRVNKDDLRAMLHRSVWSKQNEKSVLALRDQIILDALAQNRSVIVDDTNLTPRHFARIDQLVREAGYSVVITELEFDTDTETCIRRDLQRPNSVGEAVIRRMAKQWTRRKVKEGEPLLDWMEPEASPENRYRTHLGGLPDCIICDLDGTLSLMNGRDPYRGEDCASDLLHQPVYQLLRDQHEQGIAVVLFSGRNGESEPQTREWLAAHNVPFHMLVMRAPGDQRKDSIIKREMYEAHIEGKYNVLFVLDDRDQVVDLWRKELNLPCFQVWYGAF